MLLDLEIPARGWRSQPRIQNSVNLLDQIRESDDDGIVPVIIMSDRTPENSEVAVEMMRLAADLTGKEAVDYIHKPFPTAGRTLDRVIKKVLGDNGMPVRHNRRRKSSNGKTPIRISAGGRGASSDQAESGDAKPTKASRDSLLNESNEPNEPITLNEFMAKYCEKISKDRCRCRREALLAAARHRTITMPPLAERYKRGRAKKYFVHGLFDAWHDFRDKGVILPELKAEYRRRLQET